MKTCWFNSQILHLRQAYFFLVFPPSAILLSDRKTTQPNFL